MDFCSGIGAGRLGLENAGMKCVAHSEIDPNPDLTYQLFFDDKSNFGDLTKLNPNDLPNFDVMLAGFPCQTFSIAGKRSGMNDDRGQIIYYLTNILKQKNIPFFILENVKGLINHNKGETLQSILELLSDTGYQVYYQVLDSQYYGVPQMRERVYFVGIRKDIDHTPFEFPKPINSKPIEYYLSDNRNYYFDKDNPTFQKYLTSKYNQNQYDIDEILKEDYKIIDWRQSDFRLYNQKCPTLRTGRHGILYTKNGKLHKLSGYEALLLQGFPKEIAQKVIDYKLPDSKILAQAGNAMTVTVIEQLGKQLLKSLDGIKKITNKQDLIQLGSQTAKNGFKNEHDICERFHNWRNDEVSQNWLMIMGYELNQIKSVKAVVLHGYKADINVQVFVFYKDSVDIRNIQVKLVSNRRGFNQIDKRWVKTYQELWQFDDKICEILQYFTGELRQDSKKRLFISDFSENEQALLLRWFNDNKILVLTDILRGRGEFSAEWVLVAQKISQNARWILKNINEVLQYYGNGAVEISPRGSLKIGRVTMQRKGGDNGRPTANMLQFKIDPAELFDI